MLAMGMGIKEKLELESNGDSTHLVLKHTRVGTRSRERLWLDPQRARRRSDVGSAAAAIPPMTKTPSGVEP